jgi:hypothetical protein
VTRSPYGQSNEGGRCEYSNAVMTDTRTNVSCVAQVSQSRDDYISDVVRGAVEVRLR